MSTHLHYVCPHCHSTNRVPTLKLAENPVCGHCQEALVTGKPVNLDNDSFGRHIERNDLAQTDSLVAITETIRALQPLYEACWQR